MSDLFYHQNLAKHTLSYLEQDITQLFDVVSMPDLLDKACRYAMSAGGKRMRPLLAACAFDVIGGADFAQQHPLSFAMLRRSALAVELLHGYSLVHDDLPCMDNDELRRGRPTCHIVFGDDVALLVGDVLQSLAFEILTKPLTDLALDITQAARLHQIFAQRARRMVSGQLLDVLGEQKSLTQAELEAIHQDKTGALIEAAVLMGGVCANADDQQLDLLLKFAKHLGLGFQVQDDILDVIGDTKTLGKPVGSDDKLQKSTYVKLLGIDNAQRYADELLNHAQNYAKELNPSPNNALLSLTLWLQQRQK